jgi:conserved hypothetical protein
MDKKLSFLQFAKSELMTNPPEDACCKVAWLSAAIRAVGSLEIVRRKYELVFESADYDYIKLLVQYIKSVYFASLDIDVIQPKGGLKKTRTYRVKVPAGHAKTIMFDAGVIENEEGFQLVGGISDKVVFKDCCAKSYLRSLFVATGSAGVPTKIIGEDDDISSSGSGYYLEYLLSDELLASDLIRLLEHFQISAKLTERNGKYVVYLKDSELMSNLFALLSANETVLYMQDVIVERLLNNNLNRKSNCDVGNYDKIAIASSKQILAINYIGDTVGLEKLPEKLQVLAHLRVENPEAPLDFFVKKLKGEVSKSGINHRFRRIIAISEEIRAAKEEK